MISELTRIRVPGLVIVLAALIAVFALLGLYDAAVSDVQVLDLQAELSEGVAIPVLFTGLLLLFVAVSAALLALGESPVAMRWVWIGLSLLFFAASIDEMVRIHERLGDSVEVDWMVLYIPVFLLAGFLWLSVLRGLRGSPERLLWVGGAAAWALAQLFEVYAYGGTEEARPGGGFFGAMEELLEMGGSLLFLWTLLAVLERARPDPSRPAAASRAA